MNLKPFSMNSNNPYGDDKYDQSTFLGRWLHFNRIIDPSTLFATQDDLATAKRRLEMFKEVGHLPPGITDIDMWKAQKLLQSTYHPNTGETIPMPFRMSGYIPFGVPVIVGMLMTKTTVGAMGWQFINQSHNAGVNYSNRPINPKDPILPFHQDKEAFTGYCGAVTTAMTIAFALRKVVEKTKGLPPRLTAVLSQGLPFIAVASANVANVALVRSSELNRGIMVRDEHGAEVGLSKVAAKKAITLTAISRIVLPFPILAIPPLIISKIEKYPFLKRNPRMMILAQTVIATASFTFALPLAIALFPATYYIEAKDLEPELREYRDADGCLVSRFNFDKGI